MSGRWGAAVGLLFLQAGLASAADLARGAVPHATASVDSHRAADGLLRASCAEGDDPIVLRCLPQKELPASFGRAEPRLATLSKPRGRPYRQVFSWGD